MFDASRIILTAMATGVVALATLQNAPANRVVPASSITTIGGAVDPAADPTSPISVRRPIASSKPLDAETIERCLLAAEDIDPELARSLRELQKSDPEQFQQKLSRSKRLLQLARLMDEEPAVYDLKLLEFRTDAQVARLSREVRDAAAAGDTASAEKLARDLKGPMLIQEGLSILARKEYIERVRERLTQLEEQLAFDQANAETKIDARIAELLDGVAAGSVAPTVSPNGESVRP